MKTDLHRGAFFEQFTGSWWTLVAGTCLGLAAAVAVIDRVPRTYEASCAVRVDPAEGQTADLDAMVRARAMREALSRVRARVGAAVDGAAAGFGDRLAFRPGGDGLTVEILSRDSRRHRAARVANALADAWVEQLREEAAAQAEAARPARRLEESRSREAALREEIAEADRRIEGFLREHGYETEGYRAVSLELLAGLREEFRANEKALDRKRDALRAVRDSRDRRTETPLQRLLRLERQLDRLRRRPVEDREAVRDTRTRLEQLLLEHVPGVAEPTRTAPARQGGSEDRIDVLEEDIRRIAARQKAIGWDIEVYEDRLRTVPLRERQIALMREDRDRLVEEARALQAERAGIDGRENRAEGVPAGAVVIRRARAPVFPERPRVGVVLVLGWIVGLSVFTGPVVLRGWLVPRVFSEDGLRAVSDVPVLVSVPLVTRLEWGQTYRERRTRNLRLSALSMAGFALVLTVGWIV